MKIKINEDKYISDGIVVVESIREGDEIIFVSQINGIADGCIQTPIPEDGEEFEIVWILGTEEPGQRVQKWIDRFESSQYRLYLKAVKQAGGGIKISGI